MSVALELAKNMLHSSPQGYLGVSLIFLYFVVIVGMALYRIKQHGDH